MLYQTAPKTVHIDEDGDRYKKQKQGSELSKVNRKYKQKSTEFSSDKPHAKASPSSA